jgi:hypothetical protein
MTIKYQDTLESYSDRRRWYALQVSIETGIGADKSLSLFLSDKETVIKEVYKLINTPKRLCSEEGCKEDHYGKGYCKKHWQEKVYKNNPQIRKIIICKSCGEEKQHVGHGLCRVCYNKLKREGNINVSKVEATCNT